MTVPMVNYSDVSSLFFPEDSNVGADINTVNNGVSPFLSRLMAATAASGDILTMRSIAPAANYSLEFSAPSLKCVTAPANITTVINRVVNFTSSLSGVWPISFLAFTPQDKMLVNSGAGYAQYQEFVNTCVGGESGINGSQFYCDGMAALHFNYPGSSAYIWVKSDSDYYSCSLEDTLFSVTFNATGNVQTVNHPYSFQYTGKSLNDGHYVHGQVMSNWLHGVLWGMFQGMVSVRTRITETSLYAALKTNGKKTSTADGISEDAIPAAEKALTRGLTMGQLIEELSRNLTLSLFSADRTWSPLGANTTVNVAVNTNIYAYNVGNLALAYGLAIVVTIISVIIGLGALVVNGVSHGTSFSSIMCSTRNKTLDNMTIGYSLAAEPLSKEVLDTDLKFGLLPESREDHGLIRRVGFGVPHEVDTLRKGATCY